MPASATIRSSRVLLARCVTHTRGGVATESFELRPPCGREALIETTLSCVSVGTELRVLSQLQAGELPDAEAIVPGYARVGRVAIPGESGLAAAQRVVVTATEDAGPYTKHWGGHVSHSLALPESLIPIPDEVDDTQAVLARLAAISYHGYHVTPRHEGDHVAVVGLGAIGLFAAKFYAAMGHAIVGFDRSLQRVEQARQWGIDAERVTGMTSDQIIGRFEGGADLIIDATGVPAAAADAVLGLRMPPWHAPVSRPSRYVVQGSYPADLPLPYEPFFFREAQVLFPRDWEPGDLQAIFALISQGTVRFDRSLYTVHSPDEAPRVYERFADGETSQVTAIFNWC